MSKTALKLSLNPLVMGMYLGVCMLSLSVSNPVLDLLIIFGFIFHLFLYLAFYKRHLNWRSSTARVFFMTGGASSLVTLVFILVYLTWTNISWIVGIQWFFVYLLGLFITYIVNRWVHFKLHHLQPQNDILKQALCISGSVDNIDVLAKIESAINQEFVSIHHALLVEDETPKTEIPPSLMQFVTNEIIDGIFLHLPNYTESEITSLLRQLTPLGVDIFIIEPTDSIEWSYVTKELCLNNTSVLQLSQHTYSPITMIASEVIDIIGALVGLSLTAIFGSFIALAIKREDGGNILFLQQRVGLNGRIFTFYKFRSMVMDAEKRIDQLKTYNQMYGHMFKIKDDPRITNIGQWIRKTSLDELPQFMNVLKGEMSLIGTRPPLVSEYVEYEPRHKYRLSFKTGITGLWQVSGRNDIDDFEDIVKLDSQYINNWSLLTDASILFKTFYVVVNRKGAH